MLKGRDHLEEDLYHGWLMLEWISKKFDVSVWNGFMSGSCEHSNGRRVKGWNLNVQKVECWHIGRTLIVSLS
jgi:hypothetical protein